MTVFDRRAVRLHRDRAAATFDRHDFLIAEVSSRLEERLGDIKRDFRRILHIGPPGTMNGTPADPEFVVFSELSPAMACNVDRPVVVADEEALPFAEGAFDLVVGVLSLHWVNDLPGALIQIRRALRPDGLFVAALLGEDTLIELRHALVEAESAVEGGASPRVSPFLGVREGGTLLQRAGFSLPVVDTDTITVTWPDALSLMRDLRGMGETNAVAERRKGFSRRETLFAAAARYAESHGDAHGRIPATFQIVYLTGWAPHESQQRALRPGQATSRLADALGAVEIPAGDKADRTV